VVLAEASVDREETLIATVDPARIEEVRQGWPFLRDRRIDAYAASSGASGHKKTVGATCGRPGDLMPS